MSAAKWRPGIVFIGMETSGELRRRFQALGYETYSADLLPSEDGGEQEAYSADGLPLGRHLVGDVFETLDNLWATGLWPALGIFHPTCTNLTGCAAWAFKDPDFERFPGVGYHQKVKAGTLTGEARRTARIAALDNVRQIMALDMVKIIENPVGAIGTAIRKATQIVQPNEFGDDASKATCLWMMDEEGREVPQLRLPIDPAKRVAGRIVNGRERWGNQTDSGQNRLSPGEDRWKDRSRTFPGIADALALRCHQFLSGALDEQRLI